MTVEDLVLFLCVLAALGVGVVLLGVLEAAVVTVLEWVDRRTA